ncbi:hypothetical protein ACWDA7_27860 [Streptomyces sp. NPDC001156]
MRRQPHDPSATRVRDGDSVGCPVHGHFRTFGLLRAGPREQAHAAPLPGLHKTSW